MTIAKLQTIELEREKRIKQFRETGKMEFDKEESKRYAREAFVSVYENIKTKDDFVCKGYFLIEKILGELLCIEEDNADLIEQLSQFRTDLVRQNFSE